MKHINPYDFFGLNHDSNENDLRKKYYEMALLCHPDKGGREEDMKTIQMSYEFLKKELELNMKKTNEDIKKEFELYIDGYDKELEQFSDIYEKHPDVKKIHEHFEKTDPRNEPYRLMYNSGYSDYLKEENDIIHKKHKTNTLQIYKETLSYNNDLNNSLTTIENKNLKDYTTIDTQKQMNMNDIKLAYENSEPNFEEKFKNTFNDTFKNFENKPLSLEEIEKKREEDLKNLLNN